MTANETANVGVAKLQKAMEWTEEHDVLMLREMLTSGVFSFKKGSVSRGEAWDSIAEKLNEIESPKFLIKDKRGVRDRWLLLGRKWKIKIRKEESASGIAVGEQTENEALIEELVERENSPCQEDSTTAKQKKDKETGEDMRKKAMETMGKPKKRKSSGTSEDDDRPRKNKNKRCSEPLIHFLQEKASAERDLRQQELEIKKKEQEKQQEIIQAMVVQQQQMNQAFLSVVQKLMEK